MKTVTLLLLLLQLRPLLATSVVAVVHVAVV